MHAGHMKSGAAPVPPGARMKGHHASMQGRGNGAGGGVDLRRHAGERRKAGYRGVKACTCSSSRRRGAWRSRYVATQVRKRDPVICHMNEMRTPRMRRGSQGEAGVLRIKPVHDEPDEPTVIAEAGSNSGDGRQEEFVADSARQGNARNGKVRQE